MSSTKIRAGGKSPASFKRRRQGAGRGLLRVGVTLGAVAVLAGVFFAVLTSQPSASSGTATVSAAGYAVGSPGPGEQAPGFSLASTSGATVNLSDYRGKTVLLYFHEGIGCQPCWDQIRDLEANSAQLTAAGVDQLVTITSGPVNLIAQKMADDKLASLALADPKLDVSRSYQANKYGMMGDSRNGHSFVLVGPDGRIQWRADYGGSPKYTMYVPVSKLLTDLAAGRVAK